MGETNPGIEVVLQRLRQEAQELMGELPDARQRARVLALMAALFAGKIVESIPNLEMADASEARELKDEALELLREALEAVRDAGPRGFSLEPSLN
jgi:hypothetical protein